MILGHAVPMPMALRTRSYDETFYAWVADANNRRPPDTPAKTVDGWNTDPITTSVQNAMDKDAERRRRNRQLLAND
jgi:hypothetical protein